MLRNMLMDGALGDPKLASDPCVGAAFGHQLKDLSLARRQVAEGIVNPARGDELLDRRGVDDRAAAGDPLERLEKVAHLRDPALQEVADPFCPSESRSTARWTSTCAKSTRMPIWGNSDRIACAASRPSVVCEGGHADVEHDEVGELLAHQLHQLAHVASSSECREA